MPEIIYARKDDPLETVRIISQEKTPNGSIRFEFLSPPSAEGKNAALDGHVFCALYRDTRDKGDNKSAPERPYSTASRDAWRDYALWLEREYEHTGANDSHLKVPLSDAEMETLGTMWRRARR